VLRARFVMFYTLYFAHFVKKKSSFRRASVLHVVDVLLHFSPLKHEVL
jgi:hypothetical protein